MRLDFYKSALIAGVAMGFARIYSFANLFLLFRWDGKLASSLMFVVIPMTFSFINLIFALALPTLLIVLFTTRAQLRVPCKLRNWAIAATAVEGVAFVVPSVFRFVRAANVAREYSDVQFFAGEPLASQLERWIGFGGASDVMREGVMLAAQLGFLFFLIYLLRGVPGEFAEDRTVSGAARTVAAIVLVVNLASAMFGILYAVWTMIRWKSSLPDLPMGIYGSPLKLALGVCLPVIYSVLLAGVAWILLRSLPRVVAQQD